MSSNDGDALRADHTGSGQKILVVDDDLDFAAGLVDTLEIYGYTAKVASTIESALAVAKEYRPDGLLCDLRLGNEHGLDLIPALRKLFPNLVCIIVTGYPEMETAIGAIRNRADDYFRKPFPPEDICKVLKRCFVRLRERRRGDVELARENYFGRLLVRRFASMFIENADDTDPDDKILSRRILPGFFVAVDMMLGPECVEEYQRRCHDIIRRLTDGDKAGLSWDDFYADPEANNLVLDAQIKMALHFREIDKRIMWLTTLINNHVGSLTHQPVGRAITQRETTVLLSLLFKDLSTLLSTERGRETVFRRYGQDTFMRLARVTDRFRPESIH